MSVGTLYAHYYASNVEHATSLGIKVLQEARSRTRALATKINSQASTKSKQNYANVLNSIFNRQSSSTLSFDKNKAQQILEQFIIQKAEKTLDINWDSGRVQKIIDQPDAVFKPDENIEKRTNKNFMSESVFQNFLKTINKIIIDMSTKTTLRADEPAVIIRNLQDALRTFSSAIAFESSQVEDNSLKALLQSIEKQNPLIKNWRSVQNQEMQNIIAYVNQLIDMYYFSYSAANIEQGNLFEGAGVMAGGLLNNLTLDSIEEKLSETLTEADLMNHITGQYGDVNPHLKFSMQYIPNGVYKHTFLNQDIKHKNGMVITSKHTSKQKIDVIVDLQDNNQKKIAVPMSFKSYKLTHTLSIVSGTNLWYLLQDESLDFLNNYLNIMSDHTDSIIKLLAATKNSKLKNDSGVYYAKFKTYLTPQAEYNAFQKLQKQRSKAILAAQLLSFVKSVSGATYEREAAKLMVINDINTKKIYVIEISDIINYLMNNLALGQKYNAFIEEEDGTNFNIVYKNEWASTKNKRIAEFINQMHNQTISLGIKPNVFQQVSKITGN